MTYDVAIVGSGPAGSVAALRLARAGLKVALYERQTVFGSKIGESLPGAARAILRELDLLDLVDSGPHLRSAGNAFAWNENKLSQTDSLRDPHGAGWHLDRARFDADLRQAALEAGAKLIHEQVSCVDRGVGAWVLRTDTGSPRARWIIDATGRHATIARRLGARVITDSTLMAVYGWFQTGPHDQETRTLVEATTEGWWYTARVPHGLRVVAFQGDAGTVGDLAKSDLSWNKSLASTTHVSRAVKNAPREGLLHTTQAWGATLDRFHGDRWIAVGDAATAFDPLSSQGIYNALFTGLKAADALLAHQAGDKLALQIYGASLLQIRDGYLSHHSYTYLAETRWNDSVFWKHAHLLALPRVPSHHRG